MELARPLSISTPEWPPLRPVIFIVAGIPDTPFLITGRCTVTEAPPAQLTSRYPSSSESILSIIRDLRGEQSSAAAPVIPTSSSTVNTASIGGCGILSDSSIASA